MTIRFQDLAYEQLRDGTIRIEQIDYAGEAAVIDMHPAQLRYIAEFFGLVVPNYPADELTKRLARQLCEIQRELAPECHRSPKIERTFSKLDAFCGSLPDALFPYDLWDESVADGQDGALAHRCERLGAGVQVAEKIAGQREEMASVDADRQLGLGV